MQCLQPIEVGNLYHDSDDELQAKLNDMYKRGYEPIAFLGDFDYYTKWVFKAREGGDRP